MWTTWPSPAVGLRRDRLEHAGAGPRRLQGPAGRRTCTPGGRRRGVPPRGRTAALADQAGIPGRPEDPEQWQAKIDAWTSNLRPAP
ncbi:hypothetical protein [Nonomuraea dietziae]|uniref:hypothetical protein n=1 Tax=Nonomuraea dietziae TaxID=65515 RepID=UPI0031E3FE82